MFRDQEDDMSSGMILIFLMLVGIIAPFYLLVDWLRRPFKPLNYTWQRSETGQQLWLGPTGGHNLKRASRQ